MTSKGFGTKKQGAGTATEHFIQDAAELRLTARLQEEAERLGVASKNISSEINKEFQKACVDGKIETKFSKSKYSKNIEATYQSIVQDLIKKYPDRKFYFQCVDAEYRNLGKKGDILILKSSVNYTHNSSMEIGVRIDAENVKTGERRHTATAYLTFVSLDENGNRVNGRGDSPNRHDTLTGAMADGTAFFAGQPDRTCSNWTSSDEGQAMVGHFDRQGGGNTSWNAAHPSRSCSQSDLEATGGDGLYMCFAAD